MDLKADVQRCIVSNCNILVAEDINVRLEHVDRLVKESSGNGKKLKKIIDEYELKVLNIQPGIEGK